MTPAPIARAQRARLHGFLIPLALAGGLSGCRATASTAPTQSPDSTGLPLIPLRDSTFLAFTSDFGDYIGQNQTQHYRYADGYWLVRIDSTHRNVEIAANGPNFTWNWTLHLQAPAGHTLIPGAYEGATRWPFQAAASPGLDFTGEGRGCNQSSGRFVITTLLVTSDTIVRHLHATFEQHCENAAAALRGEVSIVANPWRAPGR